MKKFIAAGVVAAMLICCLPLFSACADDNTDKLHAQLAEQGYELVFEDNFDGDSSITPSGASATTSAQARTARSAAQAITK